MLQGKGLGPGKMGSQTDRPKTTVGGAKSEEEYEFDEHLQENRNR